MTPSQALKMHRQAVLQIVLAHNATNARVFGSVSQGLDDESSDLDILVDPTPMTSLFDIGAIRRELKQLLGVKVDVLTPNALPDSFRSQVLSLAQPIWKIRSGLLVSSIDAYEMRNALAHGYFKVDLKIVWDTIQKHLPALHAELSRIKSLM